MNELRQELLRKFEVDAVRLEKILSLFGDLVTLLDYFQIDVTLRQRDLTSRVPFAQLLLDTIIVFI